MIARFSLSSLALEGSPARGFVTRLGTSFFLWLFRTLISDSLLWNSESSTDLGCDSRPVRFRPVSFL